jgi:chemotaxis signal transduction protein
MKKTVGGFHTPLQQLLLLEERIRLAGATLPEDVDQQQRFHGIKCIISGVDCLVDIRLVSEVIEDKQVTPIPGCVQWIEGVMNYRGTLVTVYNINLFLHRQKEEQNKPPGEGPLIVLRYANELSAIHVDHVMGMQKYQLDDFRPVAETGSDTGELDYYTDASIDSEEKHWHRFDVIKLLDEMTGRDPRMPQVEEEAEIS